MAWQSIFWGRQLLNRGIRWHINDGNSILCKVDNWISTSFLRPPQVRADTNPSIFWTSQLMDGRDHIWKITKLIAVFHENEVQNILSIPLSVFRQEDEFV